MYPGASTASGKPAYKGLGREAGGQAELHPREQAHWSGTPSRPAVMWTRRSRLWSGPCITPSLQGRSASKWGRLCTNQKTQQVHCKNTAKPPGLVPPLASLPGSMPHGAQAGPRHPSHTRSTHAHVSCAGGPPRHSLIFKKRLTMYYS